MPMETLDGHKVDGCNVAISLLKLGGMALGVVSSRDIFAAKS